MLARFLIFFVFMSQVLIAEDHYILASYPRTANTWMRYCIEYLLKCPTFGPGGGFYEGALPYDNKKQLLASVDREFNLSLNSFLPLGVKEDNPYFLKLHKLEDIENLSGPMILIVRNYKECIPSQLLRDRMQATYQDLVAGIENREHYYFTNIEIFDAYKGRKLLIYYEDFMKKPKETLKKILDFSGLEEENVDIFIAELSQHKEKVIEYYRKVGNFSSVTKGEDQNYFQKNMALNEKKNLDQFIAKRYPYIADKYLSRYFENNE